MGYIHTYLDFFFFLAKSAFDNASRYLPSAEIAIELFLVPASDPRLV